MAERGLLAAALLLSAALDGQAVAQGETAAAQEALQLSTWAHVASRQGPNLQLYAADGHVTRFNSGATQAGPSAAVDYRLTGVTPDGKFFVVSKHAHDGDSLFWVSRQTGLNTEVYAAPQVSPDDRFVAAVRPQASGKGGLYVWEIVGDQLLARGGQPHSHDGGFTLVRWTDNETAEVIERSSIYVERCPDPGSKIAILKMQLRLGTHGWGVFPTVPLDLRCE